jgi:hypothetical protein
MKKRFQKRFFVIFLLCLYFILVKCNVKAKSVCENEKQGNQTEKNVNPVEKASSDVFPSRDLIIKI